MISYLPCTLNGVVGGVIPEVFEIPATSIFVLKIIELKSSITINLKGENIVNRFPSIPVKQGPIAVNKHKLCCNSTKHKYLAFPSY